MADNKLKLFIQFVTGGKKDLKDAGETIKKIGSDSKKAGKSTGDISKGTSKASKGFKGLKAAIIGSGVGALVLAVIALGKAFVSNEAGQNKFAKFMNGINVIIGNLIDILAKLANLIVDAFSNPQKAMEDFKESIKKNIEVRIKSLIDMFGLLGSVIKKVFKADFKGAVSDAGKAASKFVDSQTGVENSLKKATKAVHGFVEETKKEIAQSNKLSDLQSEIDKQERELLVSRAKREAEISNLRIKSKDEEKYSAEERKQFLIEAQDLRNSIFEDEKALAEGRLKIFQERNKMSGSTKEDLAAEAQAEAELINLAKQRDDANRRLFTEQQTLTKQAAAERAAEVIAEKEKNEELILSLAELNERYKELYDERIATKQEKLLEEQIAEQELLLEARENNLINTQQYQDQLLAIEKYYSQQRLQIWINESEVRKGVLGSIEAGYDAFVSSITDKEMTGSERRDAIWDASKKTFIKFMGDMLKKAIANYIAQELFANTAQAASIASSVVTGRAIASAYSSAAAMASLASFGANAYPATAGIAATVGLAHGLALAEDGMMVDKPLKKLNPNGGVFRGPSHRNGGIPVETEGKEIFLTKGVYEDPQLRAEASDLNVRGGGIAFADGGGPSLSSSVGKVSNTSTPSTVSSEMLRQIYRELQTISMKLSELKLSVVIETSDPDTRVKRDAVIAAKLVEGGDELANL